MELIIIALLAFFGSMAVMGGGKRKR